MSNKRKRPLSLKLGFLLLVLLVALGIMGTGYAGWIDTVSLPSVVEMGTWDGEITIVDFFTTDPDDPGNGSINCGPVADGLQIVVTDAQYDAETIYYHCEYNIANPGSVPVNIETKAMVIVIDGIEYVDVNPADIVAYSYVADPNDTDPTEEGTQIDPGAPASGVVRLYLTGDPPVVPPETYNFTATLTFTFETWNN